MCLPVPVQTKPDNLKHCFRTQRVPIGCLFKMLPENTSNKPGQPLLILVVDDDELNRRMMELLLRREGHTVDFATNGQEALEAIKAKRYEIVLMDLQMPVMDGLEASRRIREWEGEKRFSYIVALTASYLPEKGRELFEAGIDNYLSKPFEVEHLRNMLLSGYEGRKRVTSPRITAITPEMLPDQASIDFQLGILRVGGNREIYKELLQDFIDELPAKLEKLKFYWMDKDTDSLYRAAHNLKGVSANLGALPLSAHAGRLEKQVHEGYNDTVEGLLSEIAVLMRKLTKSALDFLAAGN